MPMTKKHFEAIARVLRDSEDIEEVRTRLADYFTQTNDYFQKGRFLKAARPEEASKPK